MKKFILGFITGGVICGAVTGFAVEYAVTANPFPVKVNDAEAQIEGYNINDSTYFKLRDVSDAVGGFTVGFEDDTIIIDTAATPTPSPEPPAAADTSELNEDGTRKYTVDGLLIQYRDNIGYVYTSDIEKLYNLSLIGHNCIYDSRMNKIEIPIQTHSEYVSLIPVDFYENTLIPFISTITE